MIVKELFGTQIINSSILFANSNISVKYCRKGFSKCRQYEVKLNLKKKATKVMQELFGR
jgi:hypothetical protein